MLSNFPNSFHFFVFFCMSSVILWQKENVLFYAMIAIFERFTLKNFKGNMNSEKYKKKNQESILLWQEKKYCYCHTQSIWWNKSIEAFYKMKRSPFYYFFTKKICDVWKAWDQTRTNITIDFGTTIG